jgi:hypothetical protein
MQANLSVSGWISNTYFIVRKAPRRYPAVEWTTPLGLPVDPDVCGSAPGVYPSLAVTYVEDKQWVLGIDRLAGTVALNFLCLFVPPKVSSFSHVDFAAGPS